MDKGVTVHLFYSVYSRLVLFELDKAVVLSHDHFLNGAKLAKLLFDIELTRFSPQIGDVDLGESLRVSIPVVKRARASLARSARRPRATSLRASWRAIASRV